MSTQICIIRKDIDVKDENGRVIELNNKLLDGDDYQLITVIGSLNYLYDRYIPLVSYLPLDTPIYSIDNDTELKTIGDYLTYIEFKHDNTFN